MGKTIEVYIKTKEVITRTSLEGRPLAAGGTVHYCSVKKIAKTEKMISEEEKAALTLAETFANQGKFHVHVIDVTNAKGKLRARLKGVKSTPTIVVGNKQLVGVPKKEEIYALLEQ
jgi:protein-disulfide isomerase